MDELFVKAGLKKQNQCADDSKAKDENKILVHHCENIWLCLLFNCQQVLQHEGLISVCRHAMHHLDVIKHTDVLCTSFKCRSLVLLDDDLRGFFSGLWDLSKICMLAWRLICWQEPGSLLTGRQDCSNLWCRATVSRASSFQSLDKTCSQPACKDSENISGTSRDMLAYQSLLTFCAHR